MKKLSDLFNELEPWLVEVNEKVAYNEPILDDLKRYHYLYCWVNIDTQWCYIGYHNSYNPKNEERYLGSCHNGHYWNSRRIHQYECIILEYADSYEKIRSREEAILTESFLNKYKNNGIFNLTTGGNGNAYHLHQPEVYNKMIETYGCLPINTAESRKLAFEVKATKYDGDICGQMHTPEAIAKRISSIKSNWSDPSYREKMRLVRQDIKDRNNGILPMNSPESQQRSIETRRKNGNGDACYGFHTPEAQKKRAEKLGAPYPLCIKEIRLKSIETKRKNSKTGDPYESIHTPEVYEKCKESKWVNGFNSVVTSMLQESDIFTIESYVVHRRKVSPRSAPAPDWISEFIKIFRDRLNLSNFREIILN